MSECLVGLFSSPDLSMPAGKKGRTARRASLQADMGASLQTLFAETEAGRPVERILEGLLEGSKEADER